MDGAGVLCFASGGLCGCDCVFGAAVLVRGVCCGEKVCDLRGSGESGGASFAVRGAAE